MYQEPKWKSYIVKLDRPLFTPQQCDDIINLGQSLPKDFGSIGNTKIDSKKETNLKIRKSFVSWILPNMLPPAFDRIQSAVNSVNTNFFNFTPVTIRENAQFTVYDKKGHYNWHMDSNVSFKDQPFVRKVSMSVLLNDPKEFTGGKLEFVSDGHVMELNRGEAVFFASFINHRVTPVTKGIRKSLVMWFNGEPLR